MALTKYFVILFLVYLNFDISPLHSAVIPRNESSDIVNINDETTTVSSVNYSTTVTNDDDIEKIFESYENQYIKNSNWFNDDVKDAEINSNDQKSLDVKSEENDDLEITDPTADDVVESIHDIMDDKIEKKTNRTDRTIVVVVTTNVFNVNGSDDSGKRQHTLLSFGTPGMFTKSTSTDATIEMHNKITTEFFNSNPSPIIEQSGITKANNEKFIPEDPKGNEFHEEKNFGSGIIVPENENEDELDISTTEKPKEEEEYYNFHGIDIRRLHNGVHDTVDIPSSNYNPAIVEGRSFDDSLSNDNSNDVLRIMIPSRSDDEINLASLSKPFDIPMIEEQPDSSLMEAMENILDTDVREAFERDIPETRHVPLDINIEEEALFAPLKDLNEYIVEEIPLNYDAVKENENETDNENKAEVDRLEKEKELLVSFEKKQVNGEHTFFESTERVDDLVSGPITEYSTSADELPSTEPTRPTTTAESIDTSQSIADNQITLAESEDSSTTTESYQTNDDHDDDQLNEEKILQEDKIILKSEVPVTDNTSEENETSKPEDIPHENDEIRDADEVINNSEIAVEIPEIAKNKEDINIDDDLKSPTEPTEKQDEFITESLISIETDRRLRHTDDNEEELEAVNNELAIESFEKLHIPMNERIYDDRDSTTILPTTNEPITAVQIDVEDILDRSNDTFNDTLSPYGSRSTLLQKIESTNEMDEHPIFPMSKYSSDDAKFYEENSSTTVKLDEEDEGESVKVQETTGQYKEIKKVLEHVVDSDDFKVNEERSLTSVKSDDALISEVVKDEETSGLFPKLKETEVNVLTPNIEPFVPLRIYNRDDTNFSKERSSNTVILNSEGVVSEVVKVDEATLKQLEYIESTLKHLARNSPTFLPIDVHKNDEVNDNEERSLTTTKPNEEDVVSEVVKVDEETTEEHHQIIKKPGVNDSDNDDVEIKPIKVTNDVSNELLGTKMVSFQSRSFSDNDEPDDPLRTLVEGVELTAEVTKTVDHFQSVNDQNSAIHYAANQVVETEDDMGLVNSVEELNSSESSEWCTTAKFIFIGGGVLSIGLIVLLGVLAVVRFRQFKRNILFSC